MAARTVALITLTMLSTAAFCTLVAFSVIQNGVPNNGIFNQTPADLGKKYPTDIDPAPYAFSIWFLIFLFQTAWIGYAFSAMCRSSSKGLVMMNPVVLPMKFHFAWILSCSGIVLWCFLIDRDLLMGAALALAVSTILGFVAMSINLVLTSRYEDKLRVELYADLICIRVLVQNGLGLFFAWLTVATLLSVAMSLAYDPNSPHQFSQEDSSSLCLYILGGIVVAWSILENTKLYRVARYLYAGYFVFIWALSAIIVQHPDVTQKNTIITIALLCVTIVCLVAKIVVFALSPSAKYRVHFYSKTKKYKLLDEEHM